MPARTGTSGKRRTGGSPKGAPGRRGRGGRVTPSKRAEQAGGGRYTPPIPNTVRRSPPWYPWALLSLLVIGIFLIILDYTEVMPASPNGGYLVGGIAAILVAALMATRYR